MASKITGQGILMIGIIAIIGIYLFGQLMPEGDYTCTSSDLATADEAAVNGCTSVGQVVQARQFDIPSNVKLDSMTLWIIKLVIIGGLVGLAYWTFSKIMGHSMGRKDILTLVIIGVAVFFAWKYIAGPLFDASSLDNIAWKFGQKLGMIN